jgi:hypothetical protein
MEIRTPPTFINMISVRYQFSEKYGVGVFYLGAKVMEESSFKLGESIGIRQNGENTYSLFKDNVFGSKLVHPAKLTYFSRLQFNKKIVNLLGMATPKNTIIIPHTVHTYRDDPDKNYIELKF